MSDLKKEVENLEEVNVVVKDAAPSEPTHLKNDAVDMGKAVLVQLIKIQTLLQRRNKILRIQLRKTKKMVLYQMT